MHKAYAAVGSNDAETMVAEAGTPSLLIHNAVLTEGCPPEGEPTSTSLSELISKCLAWGMLGL